jgi:hypothetical protein
VSAYDLGPMYPQHPDTWRDIGDAVGHGRLCLQSQFARDLRHFPFGGGPPSSQHGSILFQRRSGVAGYPDGARAPQQPLSPDWDGPSSGVRNLRILPLRIRRPPVRVQLKLGRDDLDLVMHEYDAIRQEVVTTLTNQVSTLSFGAATVGLLVAAGAALWDDAELLSGLLLLFVVPSVCFLTLAIYSGELVRLMRAGLFLNALENCVNRAQRRDQEAERPDPDPEAVLIWEQWRSIRFKLGDVDALNRTAIVCVFILLAIGFMLMGWWRLHTMGQADPAWATWSLIVSTVAGAASVAWVLYLNIYAYRHRGKYDYTVPENTEETTPAERSGGVADPQAGQRHRDTQASGDRAGSHRAERL